MPLTKGDLSSKVEEEIIVPGGIVLGKEVSNDENYITVENENEQDEASPDVEHYDTSSSGGDRTTQSIVPGSPGTHGRFARGGPGTRGR